MLFFSRFKDRSLSCRSFMPLAALFFATQPLLAQTPTPPVERNFVQETGFTYGPWRSSVVGGGGYVQNVVPCPSNSRRFYTYVDVGGLLRSDDGGENWRMLHGHLPPSGGNYEVRGLLVDPRDDKKIIVATGSEWAAKEGIYTSDDAGETFHKTLDAQFLGNGSNRSAGFILSRDPKHPDSVAAASVVDGVWLSADDGKTWKAGGGKDLYPCDLRFDWANPRRLWMCASGGTFGSHTFKAGFFRSDDGGMTWTNLSDTAPSEIIQDPVNAGALYGIFGNALIKRSRDAGATWQDFSDGLDIKPGETKPSISSTGYNALASGPDFILTGTTDNAIFFKLKSGETKWQRIVKDRVQVGDWYGGRKGGWFFGGAMGSITVDPHDAAHWFITDFFAIYTTHDAGKTWRLTINGLETTVTHTLLQDPSDPAIVHIGLADVGGFHSTDGGRRFQPDDVPDDPGAPAGGGNMKSIDLCPKLPNRLYGVANTSYYVGWAANQVFVSIDRGQTWRRSPMVGLPDMSKARCTTITADLKDPYTVYLTLSGPVGPGAGGVYKSVDGGARWTWMGDGLPIGKYYFPSDIWAHGRQLSSGPDGALIALSQGSNLVYRFDPATKKWLDAGLKHNGKLWSVAADRLRAGRFFVGARSDGLYRTDDSGVTWKRVYNGSIAYVATDAAVPGRVAGGTFDGVVLSTDGGDTWRMLDKSLPYRVDNIPAFAGDRLLVGSGGSGVFWMPLSPIGERDPAPKPLVMAAVPASGNPLPQIINKSMNEGRAQPTGWSLWTANGKLELKRDTTNWYIRPAALSLASVDGPAYGTASQEFKAVPGLFTIGGFARAQGDLKECLVAIQVFDANKKQIAWINLLDVPRGHAWWDPFAQTLSLPPGAATCELVLSLKGAGQAWLDEISVKAAPQIFLDGPASSPIAPIVDAAPLPVAVAATDPDIRTIGRFDLSDKAGPRCEWPASAVALKFQGTDLNVKIKDGDSNRWQVEVDGKPTMALQMRGGEHTYSVATGLPAGEHTIRLVKATESFFGPTQFMGFQLNEGGKLLPLPAPGRGLEVIGDSISAGYGNEAANQNDHFSAKTENAYFTYGAVAARQIGADYVCLAWSGKKLWPNNTLPEFYDRTLPLDTGSHWDFSKWTPDAVLINLATNDFGKTNPDEAGWTGAYRAFIAHIRQHYPTAQIYCAIGPMMSDWGANKPLTSVRAYLAKMVADLAAAGDAKVHIIDFGVQDMKNGIGADWHPSKKTHELMGEQLAGVLRKDLGWP